LSDVPGRIGEIGVPIGALLQALPSFELNSGFVPVSAVLPPLDAKNAYARAPQIAAMPCV
jgi:hypothetical protein